MSTPNKLALLLLLLGTAVAAAAGLTSSITPQIGGGIGAISDGGITAPRTQSGSACNGAIDLTTSCVQPMLGGL